MWAHLGGGDLQCDEFSQEGRFLLDQPGPEELRVVRQSPLPAGDGDGRDGRGAGEVPGDASLHHFRPPEIWHEVGLPPAGHGFEFQKRPERLCDGSEVSDQRWQTQLEQSVHQDQTTKTGKSHGLLLWKPHAWQNPQGEMQWVRIYFQEGSFLITT